MSTITNAWNSSAGSKTFMGTLRGYREFTVPIGGKIYLNNDAKWNIAVDNRYNFITYNNGGVALSSQRDTWYDDNIFELASVNSFALPDYRYELFRWVGYDQWCQSICINSDGFNARRKGIDHVSPVPGCTCGFYASYAPGQSFYRQERLSLAYAVIEASGRIILSQKGFRAEKMRVLGYCVGDAIAELVEGLTPRGLAAALRFNTRDELLAQFPQDDLTGLIGEENWCAAKQSAEACEADYKRSLLSYSEFLAYTESTNFYRNSVPARPRLLRARECHRDLYPCPCPDFKNHKEDAPYHCFLCGYDSYYITHQVTYHELLEQRVRDWQEWISRIESPK